MNPLSKTKPSPGSINRNGIACDLDSSALSLLGPPFQDPDTKANTFFAILNRTAVLRLETSVHGSQAPPNLEIVGSVLQTGHVKADGESGRVLAIVDYPVPSHVDANAFMRVFVDKSLVCKVNLGPGNHTITQVYNKQTMLAKKGNEPQKQLIPQDNGYVCVLTEHDSYRELSKFCFGAHTGKTVFRAPIPGVVDFGIHPTDGHVWCLAPAAPGHTKGKQVGEFKVIHFDPNGFKIKEKLIALTSYSTSSFSFSNDPNYACSLLVQPGPYTVRNQVTKMTELSAGVFRRESHAMKWYGSIVWPEGACDLFPFHGIHDGRLNILSKHSGPETTRGSVQVTSIKLADSTIAYLQYPEYLVVSSVTTKTNWSRRGFYCAINKHPLVFVTTAKDTSTSLQALPVMAALNSVSAVSTVKGSGSKNSSRVVFEDPAHEVAETGETKHQEATGTSNTKTQPESKILQQDQQPVKPEIASVENPAPSQQTETKVETSPKSADNELDDLVEQLTKFTTDSELIESAALPETNAKVEQSSVQESGSSVDAKNTV